jgi:hypothetical protein
MEEIRRGSDDVILNGSFKAFLLGRLLEVYGRWKHDTCPTGTGSLNKRPARLQAYIALHCSSPVDRTLTGKAQRFPCWEAPNVL